MKEIVTANNVTLVYDDTLVVGDLITTYHSGYHRLTRIEDRGERNTPLFHYNKVYDSEGNPRKGRNACDASYCRSAKEGLPISINNMQEKLTRLTKILQELG